MSYQIHNYSTGGWTPVSCLRWGRLCLMSYTPGHCNFGRGVEHTGYLSQGQTPYTSNTQLQYRRLNTCICRVLSQGADSCLACLIQIHNYGTGGWTHALCGLPQSRGRLPCLACLIHQIHNYSTGGGVEHAYVIYLGGGADSLSHCLIHQIQLQYRRVEHTYMWLPGQGRLIS
jgi:hypothetical protein